MPEEILREFIGKQCVVNMFNEIGGCRGIVVSVENNWFKFEEKKKIRVINGDMIRDITVQKE